jgi:hypothetical protein
MMSHLPALPYRPQVSVLNPLLKTGNPLGNYPRPDTTVLVALRPGTAVSSVIIKELGYPNSLCRERAYGQEHDQ